MMVSNNIIDNCAISTPILNPTNAFTKSTLGRFKLVNALANPIPCTNPNRNIKIILPGFTLSTNRFSAARKTMDIAINASTHLVGGSMISNITSPNVMVCAKVNMDAWRMTFLVEVLRKNIQRINRI